MRTKILTSNSGVSRARSSERGYLLLSVMLLITIMMIMLAIEAPRIGQQIKREKEDELVFRGKEYAIAIKRFYHKNGTYPLSVEQLEDTNHIRFLRKRYKDPMTADGEWKLIHVGEAQFNIPTPLGIPGQPGALGTITPSGTAAPSPSPAAGGLGGGANTGLGGPGLGGGANTGLGGPGLGGGASTGLGGPGLGGGASTGLGGPGLGGGASTGLGGPGLGGGASTGLGGSGLGGGTQPGPGGQMGTLATQNIGTGLSGSSIGGGPIMGVASTSKKTSIKQFNGNDEYDEWLFVYDPRGEQSGGGGVFIAAPRVPGAPQPGVPGAPPSGSPSPGPVPSPAPQPGVQQ